MGGAYPLMPGFGQVKYYDLDDGSVLLPRLNCRPLINYVFFSLAANDIWSGTNPRWHGDGANDIT